VSKKCGPIQRKSFICKRYQSRSSSEEELHLEEISIRKFFRGRVSSARDVRKEGLKGVESKLIIAPPQG
jgi:hypothetical protein